MSTDPLEWTNKATKGTGLTSWYQRQQFVLNRPCPTPTPQEHGLKSISCAKHADAQPKRCSCDHTTVSHASSCECCWIKVWKYLFAFITWYNVKHLLMTAVFRVKGAIFLESLLYVGCPIIAFTAHLSEYTAVPKWGYTIWNSNYKTSGAFNLLLISQQLSWKTQSPINVSKYDPAMSWPSYNTRMIK